MIKSQRRLRWCGGLGLAVGLVLVIGAPVGGELAGLLSGYGTMLAAAAVYLLAGQWLVRVSHGRRVGARTAAEQLQQHGTPQV